MFTAHLCPYDAAWFPAQLGLSWAQRSDSPARTEMHSSGPTCCCARLLATGALLCQSVKVSYQKFQKIYSLEPPSEERGSERFARHVQVWNAVTWCLIRPWVKASVHLASPSSPEELEAELRSAVHLAGRSVGPQRPCASRTPTGLSRSLFVKVC